MTRAPLTITSDQHPFELGCFACAVAVGCWGLFVPGGASTAVDKAFPHWFVDAYYALICVGGAAALLCTLLVRDQDLRIRLVRCCLYPIGWGALGYSIAAVTTNGAAGGTAAMPWFWVSVVCTWRIVQIAVERRRLRAAKEDPHPADPSPLGCADARPRRSEGGSG